MATECGRAVYAEEMGTQGVWAYAVGKEAGDEWRLNMIGNEGGFRGISIILPFPGAAQRLHVQYPIPLDVG